MAIVLISISKNVLPGENQVLVDLQKLFVFLDLGVLLEKMIYFGFCTSAIKWLE